MISTEQKQVLKKALETYGETNQLCICIEELSELTKEITSQRSN